MVDASAPGYFPQSARARPAAAVAQRHTPRPPHLHALRTAHPHVRLVVPSRAVSSFLRRLSDELTESQTLTGKPTQTALVLNKVSVRRAPPPRGTPLTPLARFWRAPR
eukprot:2531554-Prymnesium_polylepis.1